MTKHHDREPGAMRPRLLSGVEQRPATHHRLGRTVLIENRGVGTEAPPEHFVGREGVVIAGGQSTGNWFPIFSGVPDSPVEEEARYWIRLTSGEQHLISTGWLVPIERTTTDRSNSEG